MFRIKTPTRQIDKWGQGKDGFTNGNPQTGLASTQLEGDWYDILQEEVSNAVELAGLTLSPPVEGGPNHGLGDLTQLYQAIQAIAGGLNPDLSGFVRKSGDTMTGPLVINHAIGTGLQVLAPPNIDSHIRFGVGGQFWVMGTQGFVSPGEFWIFDSTANALRLSIALNGVVNVLNGLNVTGGNGIAYQYTPPHVFGFGWTSSEVAIYVDGTPQGFIARTDRFLPLTGGTLANPGDLMVHGRLDAANMLVVAGNFSAVANGDLAVTNSVRATGDVTCFNMGAAGDISAGGNLTVGGGGFSLAVPNGGITTAGAANIGGDVLVGNSVQVSGGGWGIVVGAIHCNSQNTGYGLYATGGSIRAAGGLIADSSGSRFGSAPNYAETAAIFNGRVQVVADGVDGFRVDNASVYFPRALGVGTPATPTDGTVNVSIGYFINGGPAVLVSAAVNDALLAAPEDSAFIIRKVRNATADADPEFSVMQIGIDEPEARTGRRFLYLIDEALEGGQPLAGGDPGRLAGGEAGAED